MRVQTTPTAPGLDDWRFIEGRWNVHHRRLVARLAGSDDWQDFAGTSELFPPDPSRIPKQTSARLTVRLAGLRVGEGGHRPSKQAPVRLPLDPHRETDPLPTWETNWEMDFTRAL